MSGFLRNAIETKEPTVAVVFDYPVSDEVIDLAQTFCGVSELRGDKYPSLEPKRLQLEANRLIGRPILFTLRSQLEGGYWTGSEEERAGLYQQLLPTVDGVDIELDSEIFDEVAESSAYLGKPIIASFHDFDSTPSVDELEKRYEKFENSQADFLKIATNLPTKEDYGRLSQFTINHNGDNIVTCGMGKYGPISRLSLLGMGSLMTYVTLGDNDHTTGQLNFEEMQEFRTRLLRE